MTMEKKERELEKEFENAAMEFDAIKDYKDSKEKAEECRKKVEEQRKSEEDAKKREARNKKITIISASAICAIIAIIIVIIPPIKYNNAVKLISQENYDEAITLLKAPSSSRMLDLTFVAIYFKISSSISLSA